MKRPAGPRDPIAGPDTPVPPFPIRLFGPIIKGFGRGSKELGIPTANIDPDTLLAAGHADIKSGVYYGYCSLPIDVPSESTAPSLPTQTPPLTDNPLIPATYPAPMPAASSNAAESRTIFTAVLSIGHNPFYNNETRSIEVHIMHKFPDHQFDLYGLELRLLVTGFIREEFDYESLEGLVEDIWVDVGVAERSVGREGYRALLKGTEGGWLRGG